MSPAKTKKYNSTAKKIFIPNWKGCELVDSLDQNIIDNIELCYSENPKLYFFDLDFPIIDLIPVLLKGDGSPWKIANLYILNLINFKSELHSNISMSTINSKAGDLLDYLRFMEDQGLDILDLPRKTYLRVTYRYSYELKNQIKLNITAPSTAKRRISTVVLFYKAILVYELIPGLMSFENPPFIESKKWIQFNNRVGISTSKVVSQYDVAAIKQVRKAADNNIIKDGGNLKPLSKEDQILLLKELNNSKNIEMKLIHWIALFTGARTQTICTLRFENINQKVTDKSSLMTISAGRGSKIDSKNNTPLRILIPGWLILKLQVYFKSDRASRRRDISNYELSDESYVFLSKFGQPYYKSKLDNSISTTSQPIEGNSLRQFVGGVRRKIQKLNPEFYYRFHDLRATYGMNLVDSLSEEINTGKITYTKALYYLKDRLGHSSIKTTEDYLNYRKKISDSKFIQDKWENYLVSFYE